MEDLSTSSLKREPSSESEPSNKILVKPEPESVPSTSISQIPRQDAALALKSDHDEDLGDARPDQGGAETVTNNLEQLCAGNSLDTLEAGVSVATDLLNRLQDTLSTYQNQDVDAFVKTIFDLNKRTAPTRTVVGVVGNTGAGKSSVINALLDEERLLPTNCLRACTASPSEISFNYSDDPQELYRAEIEFISANDWVRELQVLYSDLLDGSGEISRDVTKADSDAGIAYAKMKAVYPAMTRETMAKANPKNLANEPSVRAILGTTKVLKEQTAKQLYNKMQRYVDSKEKSTGPVRNRNRADVSMEYWPLIKVVRIFTKADALSTGAVIVDLPGVQDSNAARAAVAANYMKSCTGLWIVAPITRAVDDKTAKSLLGDSFKRQLKYDGTYSAVSFICSKTDDISITEAAESLGLEAEISESWDSAEDMRRKKISLQSQISNLRERKATLGQELDECEAKTDLWEECQSKLSNNETVYAPSVNLKKRKRVGLPSGSRKNRASDVDDPWMNSDSESSDKENSQAEQEHKPLTEEEVEEQISSLRTQRKTIRTERRSLDSQISGLRQEIGLLENKRDKILADVKAICIRGRNDYSRGAIKQDFAAGIKELDQENAAEENDATFDPDQDNRDYEEVARSLPVFCVSSRAYQKLSGKLEKDDFQSHGFQSPMDTEIPQLQEHAKKLTEAVRTNHCRHFLNDLCLLVNSMNLWAANDGTRSNLTDSEKRREAQHLTKLLDHLREELDSSLEQSISLINETLETQVFENIEASMPSAVEAAPNTAYSWGAPRSEGGLFWATYKATVRRQGVYSGASGPRDFNQELFDPISRNLATGWERAFQRRLPAILTNFAKEATVKLKEFHEAAKARAEQRRTSAASLLTLSTQILAQMRTIQALPGTVSAKVTEAQREANREFTPVICEAMTRAYTICTNEYGAGSYARMKEAMLDHVDDARNSMFRDATDVVRGQLDVMCRSVMHEIEDKITEVFDTTFRDYMSTLVGIEVNRARTMTREEVKVRQRITDILLDGDKMFAPASGESAREGSTGTMEAPAAADGVEFDKERLDQADELMQAHIREQGSVGEVEEEEEEEEDPFASDNEVPDVKGLVFKKEARA